MSQVEPSLNEPSHDLLTGSSVLLQPYLYAFIKHGIIGAITSTLIFDLPSWGPLLPKLPKEAKLIPRSSYTDLYYNTNSNPTTRSQMHSIIVSPCQSKSQLSQVPRDFSAFDYWPLYNLCWFVSTLCTFIMPPSPIFHFHAPCQGIFYFRSSW